MLTSFDVKFVFDRLIVSKQLMNEAFVGYEELSRSRRVLSTEAEGCGG